MSDLISRNDVLNLFDRDNAGKYWGKINNDLLHEIWCDIKDLPSAEPKKGKWGDFWKCSICGKQFDVGTKYHMNFCPNCGADMRGQNHE